MKLRSIRTQEIPLFDDFTFNLRDDQGVGMDVACFTGPGRGLLMEAVWQSWSCSFLRPRSASTPVNLPGRMVVDFDLGAEICSASIFQGLLTHAPAIPRLSEVSWDVSKPFISHGMLSYGTDTGERVNKMGDARLYPGENRVFAFLSDIHRCPVTDSVVLLRDFDSCLDSASQAEVFAHTYGILKAKRNQLLLSCSSGDALKGLISPSAWFHAPRQESLLDGVLQAIRKNH